MDRPPSHLIPTEFLFAGREEGTNHQEITMGPESEFAAIAAAAADLRIRATVAGKELPSALTTAAVSVAYYLHQVEVIASAIARGARDPRDLGQEGRQ